ncbi:hypothetical protein MNB_SV-13-1033 [hydrothermal vent metagenome]|uniref:Uncharacterized protein n=1 Tax=hydrothermal vent metagenome TaxID=652676 RepID=A0A1W1CYD7_9ZZZZ
MTIKKRTKFSFWKQKEEKELRYFILLYSLNFYLTLKTSL